MDLFVLLVQEGEESSGGEQTGCVRGGVVGEPGGDAEVFELEGVGLGFDLVALQGGPDDLADYSLVGSADDESVFGGVVFVLSLEDESLSLVVVGFADSSSSEVNLEALAVDAVFLHFNKGHFFENDNVFLFG